MKTIPPVMNARYHLKKVNILPGYTQITDTITKKELMGRRLPRIPQIEKMLQFWTGVSHPCFAQVLRFLDTDNEYVAVMRRASAQATPLTEISPTRLGKENLSQIFLHLTHAFQFLCDHQIVHPNLDLSKIYYDEKQPVLIFGHEGSLTNDVLRSEEQLSSHDVRYTAPEVIRLQSSGPKSDVYFLGALMYHFLTGEVVRLGATLQNVTMAHRILRKDWDHLIKEMIHKDPLQRPDWAQVRARVKRLCSPASRSVIPAWIGMKDKATIKALESRILESRNSPQAVALQVHPGREMVRRLAPLTWWAEDQNYLVFHTWLSEKETRHYSAINDILQLLKEGLVRHMNRPDLYSELVPLSDWQNAGDLIGKWRQILRNVFKAMVPEYCDGVVLIIEDILHMDKASLETLINMSSWLGSFPFTLVVTGDTFAHENIAMLHDQWQFDWSWLHPEPLREKQLEKMIWYGDPEQERKVNMAEIVAQSKGEEVMTYYLLEDKILRPGIFERYLDKAWSFLTLKERQLLKILSCTGRPLSEDDLLKSFEMGSIHESLNNLTLHRFLKLNKKRRYDIYFSAMEQYCRAKMIRSDKKALMIKLYDYENSRYKPDLVQRAFLKCNLDTDEEIEKFLKPIEQQVINHFRLEPLWKVEQLYERWTLNDFKHLNRLAKSIQGLPLARFKTGDNDLLSSFTLCNRYLAKGDWEKAARAFRRNSNSRRPGNGLKAFLAVRAAEAATMTNDQYTIGRMWRRFRRLKTEDINPQSKQEMTVRLLAACKRYDMKAINEKQALKEVDPRLRAWVEAVEAFKDHKYKKAANLTTYALKLLSNHYDYYWLGNLYNLHGRALHRIQRPKDAIWAYKKALACYQAVENYVLIEEVRFNMACSQHLEGAFTATNEVFETALEKAVKEEDLKDQGGAIFYLMASALFLNKKKLYEEHHATHRRITRHRKLAQERLSGLCLQLHGSFNHSKDEIEENISEAKGLKLLLKPSPPLSDEVEAAIRIGNFVLGKPDKSPSHPYPEWTAWRHNFLDFLSGCEQRTLPELVKDLGSGYLKALHLFIIKGAVENKMIPKKYFGDYLLSTFESYARSHGANYGGFLKRHFAHLRTLGQVPRKTWQAAIGIFENLSWTRPSHTQLKAELITSLQDVWPFNEWGACIGNKRGAWTHCYGAKNPEVADILVNIDHNELESAMVSTFVNGKGKTRSVLFLPIKLEGCQQALVWLVSERAVDHDLETHYEPLFRFYAKLFEFLIGKESEKKPEAFVDGAIDDSYGIIGRSPAILKALKEINRFGPSDLNIFIWGESGTGKELAASAIHKASSRARKPFRAVNCAHYPESMVEAELFGHAKGSFTGASQDKVGILEMADGGTLFLDEIGDINGKIQSLLLRVIQEGEFSRVGETQIRKVDIRFITATNKNMQELIKKGHFRKDLYFRLDDFRIDLPPLRNRLNDIPLLAKHFRNKYEPDRPVKFSPGFIKKLSQHFWPGNIRELESYIRKVLVRWRDLDFITEKEYLAHSSIAKEMIQDENEAMTLETYDEQSRAPFIANRLKQFNGNRTQAAKSLGISRQQISNLINKYNLNDN